MARLIMSVTTASTRPAYRRPLFAGAALPRLAAGLVILGLWQAVVSGFAPDFVATPSGIIDVFPSVVASSAFLSAAGVTLLAVAEGLAIAVVLGTAVGLAMGRSTIIDRALRHYVNAFNALPMIVVLPVFSLWFGYSGAARLATVVFAAIFAMIVSVADGARSMPREFDEVGCSFRSGRLRMLFDIVLPSATPYLLAGVRLAAGRALIGAVVAEFFTAINGLGYFILFNSRTFHHNEAFVAVIFLAGFGVGVDALVNAATRQLLPWYRRDEKA
jgi:ABC-type nitrate/sulfonate/bicarbonate transport system permease component